MFYDAIYFIESEDFQSQSAALTADHGISLDVSICPGSV